MKTAYSKCMWTIGLMGVSVAALAAEPLQAVPKSPPPQEPAGFITGGVIGGFAAGPVGAIIGAGIGTWLGNRVHRASEAGKAEAQVAALQADKSQLQTDKGVLVSQNGVLLAEKSDLSETNRALTSRLDQLSHSVDAAQSATDDAARDEAAKVLDGLEGDVLFRTGSAEITAEMAHGIQVLGEAVAKSPALKVRVDGYADSRGTVDSNLKLSQARADAVRDLFLAAGVEDAALEINAYGKSQSVAADIDGYALERRVRLTLKADGAASITQNGTTPAGGTESGAAASGKTPFGASGETAQMRESE
jgi:outer membrane protein OmpA-like peptidoglycan-associated protein